MDALLKCLVDITGQRDHTLLDSSVVSALRELVGAHQVRVHELFRSRDELFLRPRVWLKDGKVVSIEQSLAAASQAGEPITTYPALIEGISQHKDHAEEILPNGDHVLWLPIWLSDKVNTCIEVVSSKPYESAALHVMEGILCVYRNFQSILDYSERAKRSTRNSRSC